MNLPVCGAVALAAQQECSDDDVLGDRASLRAGGQFPRSMAGAAAGHPSREPGPRPPEDRAPPPFGNAWPALSGGQPWLLLMRCRARPHRVRPADPLKAGRDLGVIHIRVIAALAANEFKPAGPAAFHAALHNAGRLTPQARRAAVAGLTSKRKCRETLVVTARATGHRDHAGRSVGEHHSDGQATEC